jgi:hypothetical protein
MLDTSEDHSGGPPETSYEFWEPNETESYEQLLTDIPQCVETLAAASTMYCSWAERYEILGAIAHRMNCLLMIMDEELEMTNNPEYVKELNNG